MGEQLKKSEEFKKLLKNQFASSSCYKVSNQKLNIFTRTVLLEYTSGKNILADYKGCGIKYYLISKNKKL